MTVAEYQLFTAKPEDKDEIRRFLIEHFMVEEPMSRAAGMNESSFQKCIDKTFERCSGISHSVIARRAGSNEIVACALNSLWKREDSKGEDEKKGGDFDFGESSKEIDAVGTILNDLHDKFWGLVPGTINSVIHLEILSVSKDHRRKGIASKLMAWTEDPDKLNKLQASGIVAEASSLANQTLLTRRGYKTLAEKLVETVTDGNGVPLLKCDDGTDRGLLMFKSLEK
ncbi:unnamed protein product [Caenorhabditis auriculariae]|uniref:aralkylamine N-acetyltransferase n=1 Tax=Caenorhabditis auriculariae TaxID=2777116 RepID=A0A8S1HEW2_9PELO|nr:unnamed protein product [Caenorhabditis auriculariae]